MEIKVLIASTEKKDIAILNQLPNMDYDGKLSVITEQANGTVEAYRKMLSFMPDLIIINETMLRGIMNMICAKCSIIALTDVRGKKGEGNISFVYRPIHIAFASKKIIHLFENKTEADISTMRDKQYRHFARFPLEYPDADEATLKHPDLTLMNERSFNMRMLNTGKFSFSTPKSKIADKQEVTYVSEDTVNIMKKVSEHQADSLSEALTQTLQAYKEQEPAQKSDEKELIGIIMGNTPDNPICVLNSEKVSLTGGTVRLAYKDGTMKEVGLDYKGITVSGDFSVLGNALAFVNYNGFQTAFAVTVIEKVAEAGEIVRLPDKEAYLPGELFDATGAVLRIRYNDGSTKDYDQLTESSYVVEADDVSVQMELEGIVFSIPVAIRKPRVLTEISFSKLPAHTEYMVGDTVFDVSGGVLLLIYNDGTSETKELTQNMVKSFVTADAGICQTVFEYEGKTAAIDITVLAKQIVKLEVSAPPTKTEYVEDECFDRRGMVVTATYSNGDVEEIKEYDIMPKRPLVEGDTEVILHLMEHSVPIAVTVNKVPTVIPENQVVLKRRTPMFYPSTSGLRF